MQTCETPTRDPSNGRHCAKCRHAGASFGLGAMDGPSRCEHPEAFRGGAINIITGADGRRWESCYGMRYSGPCGIEGRLFSGYGLSPLLRGEHTPRTKGDE